jgi:acetolactate synthase-1/2/3 large subunit
MANPGQPVVIIAGDGGLQMNIQELETVVRNNLPLKIIVLNNQCYGMIRQFQQSYFDERYYSADWGYSAPDFASIARAYGISSQTVDNSDDVCTALEELWMDPKLPFLLQVMIDKDTNAYPKIAFGLPMTEMEPIANPIDIEGT